MKKLVIVLFLGLLTAGSTFAQWGYYYYTPAPKTPQTISGTLLIISGRLAIANSDNQIYYVPNLQPYYGINGMYVNTTVTVYGIVNGNYVEPYSYMVYGTWYTLPTYNYYYYAPPSQTIYVPSPQPRYYPNYYGWYGGYYW